MSRRKRMCFTLTAFMLVGMMGAGGTAWGGGIKLRVSAEQANIREKPDITSAILQQLPEGTALEAERKEGEWYAVLVETEEGGSVLGYVHESLVVVLEATPPEPLPQRERAEEQEPGQPPPQTAIVPKGKDESRRIGLVLWFGGRRAEVGDLNDGAEGLARYYEALLSAVIDGEVEELHFGYLFGAEVRVPLASGLYFSLGAERTSGEASSSVSYKGGSSEASYSTKPSLRTTPVSLSLLIYPLRSVYVKAGLDYTFAQCGYFYRFAPPGPDEQTEVWQEWTGQATSSGFGYQLGLGLEWSLGSRVSLIAEWAYRYSRFGGFEGEDVYKESTGNPSREEGTLYRFRKSAGGRETYPLVFIRNGKPADAGVTEFRTAELDLTGYSLKLGFKVGF
jgi:opacity protein-like surface antigen